MKEGRRDTMNETSWPPHNIVRDSFDLRGRNPGKEVVDRIILLLVVTTLSCFWYDLQLHEESSPSGSRSLSYFC
jgi:hypothetical protein